MLKWHHRRISLTLSIDDFEPHLNAIFEMLSPDGVVPLKLAKTESAEQARPVL